MLNVVEQIIREDIQSLTHSHIHKYVPILQSLQKRQKGWPTGKNINL